MKLYLKKAHMILFSAIIGSLLLICFFKYIFGKKAIFEYQRGLLFNNGKFVRVLSPGAHWISPINSKIEIVDIRPQLVEMKNQEILSKDGVSIKVSALFEYEISDAYKATVLNQRPAVLLYAEVQLALRSYIGEKDIEDVVSNRSLITQSIQPAIEKRAEALGIKIKSFGVKDIMFPKGFKEMFAQIVKARKEGLAALERARNEQASLRSLANAATMIKDNPELLSLRKIQAMENARIFSNDI